MFEELLLAQLREDGRLVEVLTKYGGETAVFYQNAPMDVDPLWEGACFPRVEFFIDRSRDLERKTAGSLYLSVKTTSRDVSSTGGNLERDIELLLTEIVGGTFYSPEGGMEKEGAIFGVEWVRSDAWVKSYNDRSNEAGAVELYGVDLTFDLIAFPKQVTTNPDPVEGAKLFVKERFPQVVVIGLDEIPRIFKPSDEVPALYWRFAGYEGDFRQTYSVNWYRGILALHLFTETLGERNRLLKEVAELLQLQGEILLLDQSPLFLQKVTVLHEGDSLREGQLRISGEYGVLVSERKSRPCGTLNRVLIVES